MGSEMQDGSGGQDMLPVKAEHGDKDEMQEGKIVWGPKMSGGNFRTVKISGDEYSLYDCIRCHSGSDLDHIGKIMRMWQTEDRKLCNIRWFFRPSELPPSVKGLDYLPDRKELFFASGKVKGVEDENLLEVIVGKCRVLCTAEDDYNKLPSSQQLQVADFFFNKAFDCDEMEITGLDILSEDIGAQKVFNKTEWLINKSLGFATSQVSSPRLHCQSSGSGASPILEVPTEVPLQPGQNAPAKLKIEDASTLKASKKRRRDETKGSPAPIVESKRGEASPDFKKRKVVVDKRSPSIVPGEEYDELMLESRKSMIPTSDARPQSEGSMGLKASHVKTRPQIASLETRSEHVPSAGKEGVLKSPASTAPQTKTVLKGEGVHPNRSVKKLENPSSGIVNKIAPRPSKRTELSAGKENPRKVEKKPEKGKLGNFRQDAGPLKGGSIMRDEPNLFKKPGLASKRKDDGKTVTTTTMPLEKKLPSSAKSNASKEIGKYESEGCREQSEHGGRYSLPICGSKTSGQVGIHGVVSKRKEDPLQTVKLEPEITAPIGKMDSVTVLDREHPAKFEQEPQQIPRRPLFKVNLEVWEESIERAVKAKRVLLLKNVDPTVHSKDLEESLTQFFKTRCEVRKAPGLTFNYYDSAAALLKLPSPKKAEEILQSMEDDCLVLGDRPIIATLFECTQFLKEFPKFPGHLDIQQKRDREDHRNALATSHAAQGNTIEFTYGQPWRLLQEQHDVQWNILRELHRKELSVFDKEQFR